MYTERSNIILKHHKRETDVANRLVAIHSRLDRYGYDVNIKSALEGQLNQFFPNKLAHKATQVKAKLRNLGYDEIPPHLDQWNHLVYPKFVIAFGARGPAWKERLKIQQYDMDCSRHGIEFPTAAPPAFAKQFAPLLGPDQYGNIELFNRRPRSTIGYQALASRTVRWPVRGQSMVPQQNKKVPKKVFIMRPAAGSKKASTCASNDKTDRNKAEPLRASVQTLGSFVAAQALPNTVKPCPKSSPFYVSGPRFPESSDITVPGPGSYNTHEMRIGRRISAQHKLGHGGFIPPPFHVRCSHRKKEKCHMCQMEVWCLPTFYALPKRKVYLCPLCYHVQRKKAVTLKPRTVARMRRVVDCGWLHTHKHFPDSDRILTHATLAEVKWLARKELYMHLHFPKRRDAIPQKGVRRYAAP
ncbi:uncharacterized protein LOC129590162 [Paramacrobiotus metropolitanus]|uniref:uncharacterized protein LOC129590162 n=1 Tax=Paramacrobiotus metropolitanus TaxID=2943436 RepID=UPI0024464BA6|nr:uncharacterized protein LOC129590162 [Paramacrobiotus metropolitanus]